VGDRGSSPRRSKAALAPIAIASARTIGTNTAGCSSRGRVIDRRRTAPPRLERRCNGRSGGGIVNDGGTCPGPGDATSRFIRRPSLRRLQPPGHAAAGRMRRPTRGAMCNGTPAGSTGTRAIESSVSLREELAPHALANPGVERTSISRRRSAGSARGGAASAPRSRASGSPSRPDRIHRATPPSAPPPRSTCTA